jgi:hypothetical protein
MAGREIVDSHLKDGMLSQNVRINVSRTTPYSSSSSCGVRKNFEKFWGDWMPPTPGLMEIFRCCVILGLVMIGI